MRRLPAEWEPQEAILLTWPHAATDWHDSLEEVTACYVRLAREIVRREALWIVTPEPERVKALMGEENIRYFECPTNDTWARDHAFISVMDNGERRLLDFRFNAWGGKFEAALDNAVNRRIADGIRGVYEDHLDLELEGGSIESDGRGTILTTVRCNLNPNRRTSAFSGSGTAGWSTTTPTATSTHWRAWRPTTPSFTARATRRCSASCRRCAPRKGSLTAWWASRPTTSTSSS